MGARYDSRIEVRMSEADRCFLEHRLKERGETISGWVRAKVAEEQDAEALARRMAAVEALCSMNIPWLPGDSGDVDQMINEANDWAMADLNAIA